MTHKAKRDPFRAFFLPALLLPLLIHAPAQVYAQAQDPVTTTAAELLDESGLIARQSRLGEGVLILERQLRHAETVEKLVRLLGPDAMIEVAPGEFLKFADTPAGMRARVEMLRLEEEIRKLAEPPVVPATAQPARSDGSELLDLIDRRITELTEGTGTGTGTGEEGSESEDAPHIFVREIFGSGADLSAILQYGTDRVRVHTGDALPGQVRILSIEPDGVLLTRRGQEIRLAIPN